MTDALRSAGQTRRLGLYGRSGQTGRCRDFCRAALADWGWPGCGEPGGPADEDCAAAVEDVLLLVSEAVTNASLHGGGPTELAITLAPADPRRPGASGDLRIEVSDASPDLPVERPPGPPGRPGGHGLMVLNRLARAWGVTPRGTGKSVWMEVAAPVPDPSPATGG
ncbi:ATP-binding protein [Streptomyces bambusae]|uniref:ATP-binding protein n=1 Tax=Streptomyces bambusae TaxID=1550616 RepID=UPI001CFCD824|nr:ATP-binding protein [Streptomyces bambusae]MCB5164239.1 ATP-binding protein [Streptomyces bambusae]